MWRARSEVSTEDGPGDGWRRMVIPQLIEHKRDGRALSPDQWGQLVRAYAADEVPDYQMSALLMAVFFRGLEPAELAALTDAMIDSGDRLRFDGYAIPVADKHSTGGVGDKVSLLLAPMVASCGVAVPMMSGRGLGHTGGTLDKLESIPGFRTNLSLQEARAQVDRLGCAMLGQTPEIAPADKRLYALRDVTATVESIPLIAASIMSKKLAEGLNGLVLDVKTGSGAFLTDPDARHRARAHDDRPGRGPRLPHRRAAHRHGPPARPRLRQRARGRGGDRGTSRQRSGRPDGGHLCLGRRDAGAGARGAGHGGGAPPAGGVGDVGPRPRDVRPDHRSPGRQSEGGGRSGRAAAGGRRSRSTAPTARASSHPSSPAASAGRSSSWAAAAPRSTTTWIRPSDS